MASRTAYSKWTPQKPTLFDGHCLRNRSTLDIGVLGYIGIVQHKEHSPEVLSIPPGTPCIHRMCNTHGLPTSTMVERKRLNVRLYEHCLSSFSLMPSFFFALQHCVCIFHSPIAGFGLFIFEVFRSHTTTHHNR